jgi:hypothetical protein
MAAPAAAPGAPPGADAQPKTLDALLFEAARLNVAIRRQYARLRGTDSIHVTSAGKYFVYVLLLQDSKFYVGSTDNIYQRLLEHTVMSPSSSIWVREHGPVQRIVEVCRSCGPQDETHKTLEYMVLFGWENVRGSHWCRVALDMPPHALAAGFERGQHAFEYLSLGEMASVRARVATLARDLKA